MTRVLILIITGLLAVGAATVAPSVALAQPAGTPPVAAPPGSRPAVVRAPAGTPTQAPQAPRAPRTEAAPLHDHGDIVQSKIVVDSKVVPATKRPVNRGLALLFWAFAAATIGGALFVITRRNLIAAVMGMVGCFLGISAVYMMLYAGFMSVIQMLVYAGAIMVLFVFVVMILNRPEDEPVAPSGRAGQVIAGLAITYLVGRLIMMLINVRPPSDAAYLAPRPTSLGHEWGSVKAVGTDLFGPGLFPFEAISITLLVAVVGAIAIARPLHEGQDNQGDEPEPAPGTEVKS